MASIDQCTSLAVEARGRGSFAILVGFGGSQMQPMGGRTYSAAEVAVFLQRVYHDARCHTEIRRRAQTYYFQYCVSPAERAAFERRQGGGGGDRHEAPRPSGGQHQRPPSRDQAAGRPSAHQAAGNPRDNDGFYERPQVQSDWEFTEARRGTQLFPDDGVEVDGSGALNQGSEKRYQRGFAAQFVDHPSTAENRDAQAWAEAWNGGLNLPEGDEIDGSAQVRQGDGFSAGFLSQFGENPRTTE